MLDGTTVEDIEQYDAKTLTLVVERANQTVVRLDRKAEEEAARKEQEARERQANVAEVANRIKFE